MLSVCLYVSLPLMGQALLYLDKLIGAFVDTLEEQGWMENSLIVVASDNGGCPVRGGTNYPLRGEKTTYWEGGVKVREDAAKRVDKLDIP